MSTVAIGLRAKSGRAVAVALSGDPAAPTVLRREELTFTPPERRQPYHAVMELPWAEAEAKVRPVAERIGAAAAAALGRLLQEIAFPRTAVRGVGIVGAVPKDCGRIGNFHIRAHAAEGVLFREVLEVAARANGLPSVLFPERSLYEAVAATLGVPVAELKARASDLGKPVGPPWRGDEKAAVAAWAVLAGRRAL